MQQAYIDSVQSFSATVDMTESMQVVVAMQVIKLLVVAQWLRH